MTQKKTSIGCLFWIALILLVLVVFLFNRKNIQNVLDQTEFLNVIQRQITSVTTTQERKDNVLPKVPEASEKPQLVSEEEPSKQSIELTEIDIESKLAESDNITVSDPDINTTNPKQQQISIFFVRVTSDGSIELLSVKRNIQLYETPLTDSVKALLSGPTIAELNSGLISLIPKEVTFNRIYVEKAVAYIDLSENFRFNRFGLEGLKAQLQQLVFTATEFPSVEYVQIILDGKKVDYLDSEGLFIGRPLERNDLE